MNALPENIRQQPRDSSAQELKVLLTTEGTYPYHSGGVSTWCQTLIESLPNVNFSIISIESTPWVESRYELPGNVDSVFIAPQWHGRTFEATRMSNWRYTRRWLHTSGTSVRKNLKPLLETFFLQLFQGCPEPEIFMDVMLKMNQYWRRHDYRRSFRSPAVWQVYVDAINKTNWPAEFSEKDLSSGLSMIQNLFSALSVEPPRSDVTHSSAAAFCSIPAILSKMESGTPMLLSEHGVYLRERLLDLSRVHSSLSIQHLYYRMIKTMVRISYHAADRILPVCDFNSKWEVNFGAAPEKITTVYNGVDPRRFSPIIGGGSGARRRPTVVSLARIDPLKDIETLLKTAALVRQELPDVRFKLYGDVWDKEYFHCCLALHGRLELDGCFEFSGHTQSPPTAYQEGDVIVLSSISEAFPYAVVEAMMCGRPVVATSVGGVGEALSDCGLTVEPRNPVSLAESCLQLLNNRKLRRAMGKRALYRARSQFTINDMADAYESIYQETAGAEAGCLPGQFTPGPQVADLAV